MTEVPSVRAPFSRGEVYGLVGFTALIVGAFMWVGIGHLDENGLKRWQRSSNERKAVIANQVTINSNQMLICGALKVICKDLPKPEPDKRSGS